MKKKYFAILFLLIFFTSACARTRVENNKLVEIPTETISSESVTVNNIPEDQFIVIGGYTTRYRPRDRLTFFPIAIGEGESADLSGIEQLQNIRSLWVTLLDTRAIDYSPLKSLPYLQSVALRWELITIPDLSGIPSLTILELHFSNLSNLNGIEKIPSLERLEISVNRVPLTDTSSLRYLKNLKSLIIYSGRYNIDFSVFGDLPELEEIRLGGGGEFDLTGIGQIKSLKVLHLYSNTSKEIDERSAFKNIEEIGSIIGLKELYLDESIMSVKFLANNVNLERLTLIADKERGDYGTVSLSLDVKPLRNLVNLKYLVIRRFELENADVLEKMPSLKYFNTDLYEYE